MNIVNRVFRKINREYKERILYPSRVKGKQKIFCIGRNKTGTTSLKQALIDLGYIVGNQRKAEKLLRSYKSGNFKPIINYCRGAQFFQDFPFSFPNTYKYLDKYYPNSKFILTIRSSPEQWYNSLVKYHSKLYGEGKKPTKEDLKKAKYVKRGWMWEFNRAIYDSPENDPYNKEILIKNYIEYNQGIIEYFKNRPKDLLVINISEKNSYQEFVSFLNIDSPFDNFPWKNKTKDIPINK